MNKIRAFTLVELMITIALIGILVAYVVPTYRQHVLESQREDTKGKILQILQLQERFLLNSVPSSYTTDLDADLGYTANPLIIRYNDSPSFSIAATLCDNYPTVPPLAECVRIIATPMGDQIADGALIADTRGRRVHDYASEEPRDWQGNAGVVCPECIGFP